MTKEERVAIEENGISFFEYKDKETCYITNGSNGIVRCTYEPEHKTLFVSNLIVNEESRNQGIGTSLIQRAIDRAKILNCKAVSLEVREDCQWLNDWYEKIGFNCVGYGYQEEMKLMSKVL